MNIIDKRASNPAAALDGTELVYVAQLGADAVTTVQDIQYFATNGFLLITTAASTYVAKNAPITGATKTKITYNTDGLITSGADATTADIADSPNRRYITDAQQTVLNNTSNTNSGDETTATIKTKLGAASSTADGYLTSTDWTTFNGKQEPLADVITANTYGNSTQYPVITFNAKGIATAVTLQTVSVAEVSASVFRIVDNTDATKKIAFQASGITTGQVRTITMPNADVDLGKVPTSLTYDAATAALTQTLTDNTSLSADLGAIAVNQLALTGGSIATTVTITGTQASTKYFLASETSLSLTFDVTAFTNTGKFIEIVNNTGGYRTITLTATEKSFKDEVNDNVTMPITMVRGESVFVFPVSASVLQVYRNKPDVRNIKNDANTITSGFKTTNLFVDSSTTIGQISAQADEILRIFALSSATINFGANVYDARTDTQISTGSYTLYAGQVLEVTKTSATKWVVLGGHIQDTSRFRLYNSSNVPTKFDTSAATEERTITMPNADVNLGKLTNSTVAPSNITVTASPFTYQNTTEFNGDVIISGGTVSNIEFTRDNTTFYTVGFIGGVLRLSPSDRVRVTYTVAPTMTLVPR